ncbi:MAG: CRISPR system precrRNA processing endoribonuclease RAMP protein Cas6 [Chloroflexi bacterium]|nr:CRISPR system precrRNA processing endoribonuclease RAMP protein Cas6 [Chloroflexota bacterium]
MTDDFAIFRCQLQPVTDLHITNQMGEAIQHLFFHLVQRVSPDVVKRLHDKSGYQAKAYAVSDLMGENRPLLYRPGQRGGTHIQRGQMAWVHFIGLEAAVVEVLHATLLQTPPADIEIDGNFWVLGDVEVTQSTTLNGLLAQHQQASPPKTITFTFQTPTTFKRKGHDLPFPLPSLVFGTLRRRWEEVTGIELSRLLTVFAEYFVSIGDYNLQSHVHFIQNTSHQSFIGQVSYDISTSMSQLKKDRHKFPDAESLWEILQNNNARRDELARALSLLAEFAAYAGVGMKTTQGMGRIGVNQWY